MYAKKISFEQITITILLGLGILIPLIHFLCNRSMGNDEAWLALNIIHKGYAELLQPLDYNQVAPVLFLMIEKFFSTLIPNSEYGLRLFPLLCYWISLFFFYQITRILFNNNKFTNILALSLFILNYYLIYYSNEGKQYICDVLVCTAIMYFILKNYQKERTRLYILGIVGALAIFLSSVAPIILSTAGLYLLYEQFHIKKTKNIAGMTIIFVVWLSVFAVYYYFFVFNHPAKESMEMYWSATKGFLPLDSLSESLWFIGAKVWSTLNMFSRRIPIIIIIVMLLISGIFNIIREKKIGLMIIICFPVIIHLLLSALHLYPFGIRFIMYFLPGLMLICTAGFKYIITGLSAHFKSFNLKLLYFIPIIFLFSFPEFPIQTSEGRDLRFEVKESIKFLKENVSDDETIYMYWLGGAIFKYYQDIGFANFKIPVIIGTEAYKDPEYEQNLFKVLDNIHGKCWLFFVRDTWGGQEFIINHLDSMGYNKIKEYKTSCSSIYLYDFK